MKNKLKISILLLFVATFSFSQNAINKCKANIKDQLVKKDTSKTVPIVAKKSKVATVSIAEKTQKTEAAKSLPIKVATKKLKETTVKAR